MGSKPGIPAVPDPSLGSWARGRLSGAQGRMRTGCVLARASFRSPHGGAAAGAGGLSNPRRLGGRRPRGASERGRAL